MQYFYFPRPIVLDVHLLVMQNICAKFGVLQIYVFHSTGQ